MKFIKKKIIWVIGILILIILAVVCFFAVKHITYKNKPQIFTVTLGDNGWSPSILKIKQGDTVVFKTSGKDAFWPASDPHPTHTDYPEFDPKQPVQPGSSWSFTFLKIGNWKYHDHLFPIYRGEVDVSPSSAPLAIACKNGDGSCYDKALSSAVKTGSLDQAFAVMDNLYKTQPSFAANCHNYAHELGQLAYDNYSQHIDFQLSSESYYCGYGFYHGFMEALLHETGNLAEAKDFCSYVGKHFVTGSGSQAEDACYHGIGHGAVDGETKFYKTSEDYIAPALALCDLLHVDSVHQRLCASGVYNALAIIWNASPGSLPTNNKDPFWICKEQTNKFFAEGCYEQMNTFVYNIAGGDFTKELDYVEKISDSNFSEIAMEGVAEVQGDVEGSKTDQYPKDVLACRSVPQALHLSCIENFMAGVVEGGAPGQEYNNARTFCDTSNMSSQEKDGCYQRLSSSLAIWYPQDKAQNVCQTLPEKYKQYCSQQS